MTSYATIAEWIIGIILIFSAVGVLTARNPVYASLYFLATLIMLAALYLQLAAPFISVLQVLVYAGAILVIFMFIVILFQDAHHEIGLYKPQSKSVLLLAAGGSFITALILFGWQLIGISPTTKSLPEGYGSAQAIGKALYIDFFFPFEAVILIFLVSIIGSLYIGKKAR